MIDTKALSSQLNCDYYIIQIMSIMKADSTSQKRYMKRLRLLYENDMLSDKNYKAFTNALKIKKANTITYSHCAYSIPNEVMDNINRNINDYKLNISTDSITTAINEEIAKPSISIPLKVASSKTSKTNEMTSLFQAICVAKKQSKIIIDGKYHTVPFPFTNNLIINESINEAAMRGFIYIHEDCITLTELGNDYISLFTVANRLSSEECLYAMTEIIGFESKMALGKCPSYIRFLKSIKNTKHADIFSILDDCGPSDSVETGFSLKRLHLYIRENDIINANAYTRISDYIAKKFIKISIGQNFIKEKQSTQLYEYNYQQYSHKVTEYELTESGNSFMNTAESFYISLPQRDKYVGEKNLDAAYLYRRRVAIIWAMVENENTIQGIRKFLASNNIHEDEITIEDEITNLESFGISIVRQGEFISIKNIVFNEKYAANIINDEASSHKSNIQIKKDLLRSRLKYLDHKYLSILDIVYNDEKSTRRFSERYEILKCMVCEMIRDTTLPCEAYFDADMPDIVISMNHRPIFVDLSACKAKSGNHPDMLRIEQLLAKKYEFPEAFKIDSSLEPGIIIIQRNKEDFSNHDAISTLAHNLNQKGQRLYWGMETNSVSAMFVCDAIKDNCEYFDNIDLLDVHIPNTPGYIIKTDKEI